MAKIDFNSSRYASFFNSKDGRSVFQSFIDESGMIRINYNWWRGQFGIAPQMTPTDSNGKATFRMDAESITSAPMMNMRAPLGEPLVTETPGIEFYTGSIPDFISDAIEENAMEREVNEQKFAEFGNDAQIIKAWTKKLQTFIDGKDQTLNNMSAQLQSTGMINWNYGRGIQSVLSKAPIPEENFVKAGAKVWSAPDCKLFTQMVQIEDDFRQRTGYQGAMKWLIPYDMYQNIFLQNAEVKEWVNYLRNLNTNSPQEAPSIGIIPDELFSRAMAMYPKLSPLEIVEEKQKNKTWAGEVMVHGWKEGIAVLRPQGDAGLIMYTDILDKKMQDKYGNKVLDTNFGALDGGIAYVCNTTMANGRYLSWQTSVMMSASPALNEYPYHIIVDTKVANS